MKVLIVFCLQAIILHIVCGVPLLQNGSILPNGPGVNKLANGVFTANEPKTNVILANEVSNLANDVIGNAIITNANFVPIANMPSDIPLSPIISEIVPSLQFGDVTMSGDLPVGGTIKVCGCFPVYGMVSVDGSVPSAGTAVVADSLGNVAEVIAKYANPVL